MYSDIEVITGVGTIETIFFGNLDQRKEISIKNFYLPQNSNNEDYNASVYK